jgi:ribosomal protein S18 acetylase RimI-like enzyme
MAEIRLLREAEVHAQLLERLIAGYTTTEVYRVVRDETADVIRFELRRTPLKQPFVKRYPLDEEGVRYYQKLVVAGHAFGAFAGEVCVGVALCEPQRWSHSLIVQELHIAPDAQRQGIGRALMAAVEAHARTERMRCVVCETQNTNMGAIRFYHALGFTVDGVDISLYSNDDLERGEVALFLKKRIDGAP